MPGVFGATVARICFLRRRQWRRRWRRWRRRRRRCCITHIEPTDAYTHSWHVWITQQGSTLGPYHLCALSIQFIYTVCYLIELMKTVGVDNPIMLSIQYIYTVFNRRTWHVSVTHQAFTIGVNLFTLPIQYCKKKWQYSIYIYTVVIW